MPTFDASILMCHTSFVFTIVYTGYELAWSVSFLVAGAELARRTSAHPIISFSLQYMQQPPEEERKVLPEIAFLSYFKNAEIPQKDEGYDAEVVSVKMKFRGNDEAKKRWLMCWQ
jgi:hypothetical protein